MAATAKTKPKKYFAISIKHLESIRRFANDRRLTANDGILVELTGIEPVASWLQTRRSPS
jgi:hypothetical protein